MGNALRLAAALRARQYAELLSACLLRPSAAALELVSRPERWRAGAALLWLVALWMRPINIGFRGAVFALFLALFCRPRAGALRVGLWLELWGFSFLPLLLVGALKIPLDWLAALRPDRMVVTAVFLALHAAAFLALFATMRLILNFARAATGGTWAYAFGVSTLSLVCGVGVCILALLFPRFVVLHG